MNISLLFGLLFQARDIVHMEHLRTNRMTTHATLHELYENIISKADAFIESYQGKYGVVAFSVPESNQVDIIPYIQDLAKQIEKSKDEIIEESFLKSQLDLLLEDIYTTLYKLINLCQTPE